MTALLTLLLLAAEPEKKIGSIDFFGHEGIDTAAVRRALPFREGDIVARERLRPWRDGARKAIREVTGRDATDAAFVCCNFQGDWVFYFGLPGNSSRPLKLRPAPKGDVRLPEDFLRFDAELHELWHKGVMSGDDSQAKAKQLALRPLAAKLEPLLRDVAAHSSDKRHRAAAAYALGHAMGPSPERIRVLIDAAFDPDEIVRNNAVRGLSEWTDQGERAIPPAPFIALLSSGTWTDRNKGIAVLSDLASDPNVLRAIRDAGALTALREMAAWKFDGHAGSARDLLEKIERLPAR